MKILIAYATYSSGTDLATGLIEDILLEKKLPVIKKGIQSVTESDLQQADLVIFASPSWRTRKGDGQPHEFFLDFIEKMSGKILTDKKFAIMGLGDKAYTHFCGAVAVLESFVSELEGDIIQESLRIDGFYFNQSENEEKIKLWTHSLHSKL